MSTHIPVGFSFINILKSSAYESMPQTTAFSRLQHQMVLYEQENT